MLSFILANFGTILVGLVLLGVVALIVRKIARDRKKSGGAGCGCGCSDCGEAETCDGQSE
ncbi:MAG: FeoB-associated Cys-rich membrane protein [Oscillospiraceae bacterium]|jgi:hypothetical protein|nr:FeoB-associated Cys-rich membrane protein [Oscillospiraceae bacterium]